MSLKNVTLKSNDSILYPLTLPLLVQGLINNGTVSRDLLKLSLIYKGTVNALPLTGVTGDIVKFAGSIYIWTDKWLSIFNTALIYTNSVTVDSLTLGYIVLDTVTMPTHVVTNKGTIYPVEKGSLIYLGDTLKLDPIPYLVYDNQALFTGTWIIWRAGGKPGLDGAPGQDGLPGQDGATPTILIGTVESGSQFDVTPLLTLTGVKLNFTLVKGEKGLGLYFNASGTLALRLNYDDLVLGFVYLSTLGFLYVKASDLLGDWGPAIRAKGEDGLLASNYIEVSSLNLQGYIQIENLTIPVSVETNTGTIYPVEKGSLTHGSGVFLIDPAPYLAYDNQALFIGTWKIWRAGGKPGLDGLPGQDGATPTILIGTVTSGNQFAVIPLLTLTGVKLNFTLVKGKDGEPGQDGATPTILIGTVTSGNQFAVIPLLTLTGIKLNFTLPAYVKTVNNIDADALGNVNIYISNINGLQGALNGKAAKATTLAGYGITDAVSDAQLEAYKDEVTAALDDKASDSHSHSYLPLSGGAMTGSIFQSTNSKRVHFGGGKDWQTGSLLVLNGKDQATYPGLFELISTDGTDTSSLHGLPSGKLIWRGLNIVRSVNNVTASDTGNITISAATIGAVSTAGGTLTGTLLSDGTANIAALNNYGIKCGNYNTFWRNDGTNLYLFISDLDQGDWKWNTSRPVRVSLSTGLLHVNTHGIEDNADEGVAVNVGWTKKQLLKYLPLTGGTLTGPLHTNSGTTNPAITYLSDSELGGQLWLFNKNNDNYKGGFLLRAIDSENSFHDFMGLGDGSLSWNNKIVVCLLSWTSLDGTQWVRKYSDGWVLQGGVLTGNGLLYISFLASFNATEYGLIISKLLNNTTALVTSKSPAGFTIDISTTTTSSPLQLANVQNTWYACGKWK